jgi:hypothetical protein
MKKLLFFLIFSLMSFNLFAAACSTTTRTNYGYSTVLTSTALNADFNQLVTKVNAFDGGCITDGSLKLASLNSSDFSALTNGVAQGCKVSYSDSNTVSIGKCMLSVNGNLVRTTIPTTATWGCSGCSAEVSGTTYYVYVKTGSTGTVLNPLISTTAPNEDGYDNSNNKVVGRFYNNSSSDIDAYSIDMWAANRFAASNIDPTNYTPTLANLGTVTPSTNQCKFYRNGHFLYADCFFVSGTVAADPTISLPVGMVLDTSSLLSSAIKGGPNQSYGTWNNNGANLFGPILVATGTSTSVVYFGNGITSTGSLGSTAGSPYPTSSVAVTVHFAVPIAGWFN